MTPVVAVLLLLAAQPDSVGALIGADARRATAPTRQNVAMGLGLSSLFGGGTPPDLSRQRESKYYPQARYTTQIFERRGAELPRASKEEARENPSARHLFSREPKSAPYVFLFLCLATTSSHPPPPEFVDELPAMDGKTVVVTGASRGLGFVTAQTLARKGAAVILLNRRSARSEEALAEIAAVAAPGAPPALVECDLLDLASVRRAAAELGERATAGTDDGFTLDVLCCNAGVMLEAHYF